MRDVCFKSQRVVSDTITSLEMGAHYVRLLNSYNMTIPNILFSLSSTRHYNEMCITLENHCLEIMHTYEI